MDSKMTTVLLHFAQCISRCDKACEHMKDGCKWHLTPHPQHHFSHRHAQSRVH